MSVVARSLLYDLLACNALAFKASIHNLCCVLVLLLEQSHVNTYVIKESLQLTAQNLTFVGTGLQPLR